MTAKFGSQKSGGEIEDYLVFLRLYRVLLGCAERSEFCIEAPQEALAKHGTPDIFNTDQGSQFTNVEFIGGLIRNGIAITADGGVTSEIVSYL
jgi:transposase InsO family protein